MQIRRATQTDLRTILKWRNERAAWLHRLGETQWNDAVGSLDANTLKERVETSIKNGETWIAEVDGQPVGTIAADQWSDPGLWTPEELSDALFIHRLMTPVSGPKGIGAPLIDHAESLAVQQGKNWLRLDAWTSNTRLRRFWLDSGFSHVRTVQDHGVPLAWGALFQRPVPPSDQ